MIIEPRPKRRFQAPSGAACATVNGFDRDMPLLTELGSFLQHHRYKHAAPPELSRGDRRPGFPPNVPCKNFVENFVVDLDRNGEKLANSDKVDDKVCDKEG